MPSHQSAPVGFHVGSVKVNERRDVGAEFNRCHWGTVSGLRKPGTLTSKGPLSTGHLCVLMDRTATVLATNAMRRLTAAGSARRLRGPLRRFSWLA